MLYIQSLHIRSGRKSFPSGQQRSSPLLYRSSFFTLFQIRRRNVDDWLTTNLGLLKSENIHCIR